MTMVSFRIDEADVAEVNEMAKGLGVNRSQILREALHQHLIRLRGQQDAAKWERTPLAPEERSLEKIADWGPAEDWSDWDDAAG